MEINSDSSLVPPCPILFEGTIGGKDATLITFNKGINSNGILLINSGLYFFLLNFLFVNTNFNNLFIDSTFVFQSVSGTCSKKSCSFTTSNSNYYPQYNQIHSFSVTNVGVCCSGVVYASMNSPNSVSPAFFQYSPALSGSPPLPKEKIDAKLQLLLPAVTKSHKSLLSNPNYGFPSKFSMKGNLSNKGYKFIFISLLKFTFSLMQLLK